jgi:IclR family transcriptional regulator, mhp operon transcriptional activator
MDRGIPIRAISRGFAVLSAISRNGPMTLMDISRASEVPYATASRIVQTLLHEGWIERERGRKRYHVTSLVQSLATGFQAEDVLATESLPFIEELCRKIGWPIAIATRVGTRMMVRASTHHMTSLTFTNYHPGFTLPIAECATGKAYLAYCEDDERQMIRDAWESTDNDTSKMGLLLLSDGIVLANIRKAGFALQARNLYNFEPGKTASLAVPVHNESGQLVGAMAVIYFASAIKPTEAPGKFLQDMQATAASISSALR